MTAQTHVGELRSHPADVSLQLYGPGDTEATLVAAIAGAQLRVLVEAYALSDAVVQGALVRARQRGLDVRVMLDPLGLNSTTTLARLAAAGILVRTPNPDYGVTHQDVVVVDTAVAAIATTALLDTELHAGGHAYLALDRDRSDVVQAASIFYDDWLRRPAQSFAHHLLVLPHDAAAVAALITHATQRIELYTAQLSDAAVATALQGARTRGVTVRVLTPLANNNPLLTTLVIAHGAVRFRDDGPGTLLVIDRQTVLIGSMDLGSGALGIHRDMGVVLDGRAAATIVDSPFFREFARGLALRPPAPPQPLRLRRQTVEVHGLSATLIVPTTVQRGTTGAITVSTAPSATVTITITLTDAGGRHRQTVTAAGRATQRGLFLYPWRVPANAPRGPARIVIVVERQRNIVTTSSVMVVR